MATSKYTVKDNWYDDKPETTDALKDNIREAIAEQGEAVTVNGDRYRDMLQEFLFTKIEEEDIGNIWFQRTALRNIQPKLHPMFCALFLKIALSAAELMLFGHFEAAI